MTASLARCVGDPERFLAEHWGRAVHLQQGGDFRDLLALDDADHILSTMALRLPAFRLVKDGRTIPPSGYTRSGRVGSRGISDLIDVGRVYALFDQGATIVLQGLQRYWAPLTRFCRDLELALTHPVQANAYITPPEAHGLRVHHDGHDVFALQTFGRKQWVTFPPGSDGTDAPTLDTQLAPGDCLYVPRGVPHAARTVEATSVHVTVGVRAYTWRDVVHRAMDEAADDLGLDEALPAGFAHDPGPFADRVAARLAGLGVGLGQADAAAVGAALIRRFWSTRTPLLDGHLSQLVGLDGLSDRTVVARRPGAVCALEAGNGRLTVTLGDRELRMPAAAEPAVRTLVEQERVVVADLAGHLDTPGRTALVRRLVREGLLVIVGE